MGLLGSMMMIWGGPDAHLGAFWGSLGSTFEVLGCLGGHFGDTLLTFIGNVESHQMYGKPVFFVGFSRVGGCLEGPG